MSLKVIALATIALLSGCAKSSEATRVVNHADVPLHVTYVSRDGAVPQTVYVKAGETSLLGEGHRLSDYDSVEFRDANKNVIFRDADPDWRVSRCVSDCAFTWYGNGRVDITA